MELVGPDIRDSKDAEYAKADVKELRAHSKSKTPVAKIVD
jgi:hypothetical protein